MANVRLSRMAQQLRDASTWVAGPRQRKLIDLADELDDMAQGENTDEVFGAVGYAGESDDEPDPAA